MDILTLDQIKPGNEAKVMGFIKNTNDLRQKLLALGIIPGVKLRIVRTAPLGDPMQVAIRGFQLALRKKEAKLIQVIAVN